MSTSTSTPTKARTAPACTTFAMLVHVFRVVLPLAVGAIIGAGFVSFVMLESIGTGTGSIMSFVSTYYRVRDIHVRVIRRNPRFINYAAGVNFFEHIDELSFGSSPAGYGYPPTARQSNQTNYDDDDEDPTFHYIDPTYSNIAIPPPPPGAPPAVQDDDDEFERIDHIFVSTEKDQKMYEVTENYLPEEDFKKVANCLVGHPSIASNPLADSTFSGTTGFATRFGGPKGVERFLAETKFNCGDFNPLLPFYHAALDPKSTGFVMNVLVADKPKEGSAGIVVVKHVDNMLGIETPNTEYYPHTVNVLYLNVPDDIEGGHLDIMGLDHMNEKPVSSVQPTRNTLCRFRGDAYHQVRGYDTNSTDKRISLVFEQYRVHPQHESELLEYETIVKNGMTMM